jgi:hypothetical protein
MTIHILGWLVLTIACISSLLTTLYALQIVRQNGFQESAPAPYLSFALTLDERHFHIIYLAIENHGTEVARNITWTTTPPIEVLANHHIETDFLARGHLSQLAPGQRFRTYFVNAIELWREMTPLVTLVARFNGEAGREYEASFVLEATQYRDVMRVGETASSELIKIATSIGKACDKAAKALDQLDKTHVSMCQAIARANSPFGNPLGHLADLPNTRLARELLVSLYNPNNPHELIRTDSLVNPERTESHTVEAVLEMLSEEGYISFERMNKYVHLTTLGCVQARRLRGDVDLGKGDAQLLLAYLVKEQRGKSLTERIDLKILAEAVHVSEENARRAAMLLQDQGFIHLDITMGPWFVRPTARAVVANNA